MTLRLSARLADIHASFLPLAVRAPPVKLAPRPVQMLSHERTESDLGARFFGELVIETSL